MNVFQEDCYNTTYESSEVAEKRFYSDNLSCKCAKAEVNRA